MRPLKTLRTALQPAPHKPRLPKEKIDATYRRMRWQVFASIFIGYAAYYLVRQNFALIVPDLNRQGFSKESLGFVMTLLALAYGVSKFVMGMVSDRSNSRYFLPLGLLLSAITMIVMGFSSWATSSITIMAVLLFANGWFQGMGWPPCGRTIVHYFSKKERGSVVATWNLAHNVGGGLMANIAVWGAITFGAWQAMLYVPAFLAIAIAILLVIFMRDTPQSVGLPPIEEHTNTADATYDASHEKEFSFKEILFTHVLTNKYIWYIALANVFVYLIRYGVINWVPTYLQEVKGYTLSKSGMDYALYEYAAIPGTLLCGWLSDTVFKGRRAPAGILFMMGVFVALFLYWSAPSPFWISTALVMIGFLIYGPVMLIGLHALDLVPKKAAGAAAGLTGLFGYLGGSAIAGYIIGIILDRYSWDIYFQFMLISCILAMLFMALTLSHGKVAKRNDTVETY